MAKTTDTAKATRRPAPRLRPAPAHWWALLGAIFVIFQAWVYGRWLLGGGPGSITWQRPAALPTATAVTVRVGEAVVVLGFLTCVGIAVREGLRHRRLGFDGAVLIGWTMCLWQDALCDPTVSFNVYDLHLKSWGPYIPGFSGTGTEETLTLIVPGGTGYPVMMLTVVMTDQAVRALTRNRPGWGLLPRYLVAATAGTLIQGCIEVTYILAGTYSYSSYSPLARTLALGSGHWYQLCLVEVLVVGAVCTAPFAVMRHTWRNGGTPVIFRGADTLPARDGSVLRALAAIGALNAGLLVYMFVIAVVLNDPGNVVSDLPAYFR
ncbi:spirocyclase AveC family protein [Streptomyces sp. NPDC048282]|uniref:spirocyclase AveC family protein n=1 Tax=Streptomyces sp. NPDC048282 TaxID=3365528 RepID=UPI00371423EF